MGYYQIHIRPVTLGQPPQTELQHPCDMRRRVSRDTGIDYPSAILGQGHPADEKDSRPDRSNRSFIHAGDRLVN